MLETMLSGDEKKAALNAYERSHKRYTKLCNEIEEQSLTLFEMRKKSVELVELVNSLIQEFINLPESFDAKLSENINNLKQFTNVIDMQRIDQEAINDTAGKTICGVAGAGVAGMAAPSVMMAIATTFGTASTGASIAGLSGAAAHSAALAWLGGGALAAGGGGMAAGNFFLGLCGPVSWGLAGIIALGGGYAIQKNNKKQAQEYRKLTRELNKLCLKLPKTSCQLKLLTFETETLTKELNLMMREVWKLDRNFKALGKAQKIKIGNLLNLNRTLTAKINKKVEISGE